MRRMLVIGAVVVGSLTVAGTSWGSAPAAAPVTTANLQAEVNALSARVATLEATARCEASITAALRAGAFLPRCNVTP